MLKINAGVAQSVEQLPCKHQVVGSIPITSSINNNHKGHTMQESKDRPKMLLQTPKIFSLEIEKVALEKKITHMDAVVWYCEKNELEPESVARLLTKGLKEKIEANARDLNFLVEKSAQLPI